MKLHFKIPQGLKKHVNDELLKAKETFGKGELQVSWRHLERAHILGQAYPIEHSQAHWHMLLFAFRIKNTKRNTWANTTFVGWRSKIICWKNTSW